MAGRVLARRADRLSWCGLRDAQPTQPSLSPGRDDRDDPKQKKSGLLIVSCNPQLYLVRMLQPTLPAGFIAPCLPTKTDNSESSPARMVSANRGSDWR